MLLTNRDKNAISYKGKDYSYSSFIQHVACYAEAFQQFPSYGKVIVYAENSFEWICALYAAWRNNGIAIPVDVQCTEHELSHIFTDAQPHIIFTSPERKATVETILAQNNLTIPVLIPEDIDISAVDSKELFNISPENREDTALILYTSGTTGSSKGVMLSYKNLFFIVNAVCVDIEIFKPHFNTMVLLPTHHILPLMGSIIAPLFIGQTIYIAENLATENILKTLHEGKISIIIGVPRLYDALAKGVASKINAKFITRIIFKLAGLIQSEKLSKKLFAAVHEKFGGHLTFLVCGGAALPKETGKIFKTLGFEVLEGYGMTETAPLISFTHPGKWTVGYEGYPLKGMEMKFEDGEICVKGDNVMQGYYNRPVETAEVIKDGWLHTGDLGYLNRYGLKLTGRKKELIVTSNGKNIDPVELETKFYKLSAYVKEVGIFMHEEILQAVILPDMQQIRNKSIQELPELMKESVLAFNNYVEPYKRIKRYHIVSEELPRTRLGKVQRFKLSELIIKKDCRVEEDKTAYSEQYLLLKNFVEQETGIVAGENAHFEIDLAMDSLSRVALLAYVENTFGLSLTENDLNDINTLAKLNQHIDANQGDIVTDKQLEWKDILTATIADMTLPHSGFTSKTINFILRYLLRMVYRYKTRGTANIPNEPCIIVANHQSMLDGVLITSTLDSKTNQNTYLFAKEKYWKNKLMSSMAKKNNVILMDINNNLREALQKLSYVLQQGKNVIIFPEGTRSKNGVKEFKDTFAILSKELNVPIVPVVIQGSDRAMFHPVKFPRYFTKVSVDFLETIYPKVDETYHELKNRVKGAIVHKIEQYRK